MARNLQLFAFLVGYAGSASEFQIKVRCAQSGPGWLLSTRLFCGEGWSRTGSKSAASGAFPLWRARAGIRPSSISLRRYRISGLLRGLLKRYCLLNMVCRPLDSGRPLAAKHRLYPGRPIRKEHWLVTRKTESNSLHLLNCLAITEDQRPKQFADLRICSCIVNGLR